MQGEIWSALLLTIHIVGAAAFGYWMMLRLLRTRSTDNFLVVVPLLSADGATDRIYAQHLRMQLLGESDRCTLVALDLGLSEQERRQCLQFCRSVPHVLFCTPQELAPVLDQLR